MKCVFCAVHGCYNRKMENAPDYCPIKTSGDGHNPLAAIYSSYYKSKLTLDKP